MKKSDLKLRLKPIIKECITEILFEQGLLSSVVSEVVRGLRPLQENRQAARSNTSINRELELQKKQLEEQTLRAQEETRDRLKEQKRKLLDAAGFQTNIFEGVEPLSKGGVPSSDGAADTQAGALAGVDPNDAGVDLSGIIALSGREWKKMI
tara:strand:- start:1113 stop:1568 length:456 start_codon:yes stop_codon:yes gene_type:complete